MTSQPPLFAEPFFGHNVEPQHNGLLIDGHLVEHIAKPDAFTYWICRDKSLPTAQAKELAVLANLWYLTFGMA